MKKIIVAFLLGMCLLLSHVSDTSAISSSRSRSKDILASNMDISWVAIPLNDPDDMGNRYSGTQDANGTSFSSGYFINQIKEFLSSEAIWWEMPFGTKYEILVKYNGQTFRSIFTVRKYQPTVLDRDTIDCDW